MDDLANVLLDPAFQSRGLRILTGEVVDDTVSPPLIQVGASTTAVPCPTLTSYRPINGDLVVVLSTGRQRVCLGPTGPAMVNIGSTGWAAASGWTNIAVVSYLLGRILTYRVTVERNGGTITVGASGDIGNVQIATAPATCQGTANAAIPGCSGSSGRAAVGTYVPNTGSVALCAVGGSTNIVDTDVIQIGGTVILDSS